MLSLQTQAEAIAANYHPPDTGRPSDIGDAQLLKELLAAIEDGNYLETACHLVGLSHVTVYNWKKRGEQGERPFDAFVNAVKGAEARAEAKMLANVRKASELPQFWAAGMTVLERRHPDRWGKRQDDSAAPRVIVQVGGNASDVRVGIAFASPIATVSEDLHRLTDETESNKRELCLLTEPPVQSAASRQPAEAEPIIPAAARGSPGPAVGAGMKPSRNFFAGKARSKKTGLSRRRPSTLRKGDETA